LFPEDYKITISNSQYNKMTENRTIFVCPNCQTETPLSDVEPYEKRNTLILEVISHEKTQWYWNCSKCKSENLRSVTQLISEKMQKPYYLKVVPDGPVRNLGVSNRLGFHEKFSNWFYNYLEELESQLGLYRIEYAAQLDDDDEPDFKDEGG
jgi:hypothetical protein